MAERQPTETTALLDPDPLETPPKPPSISPLRCILAIGAVQLLLTVGSHIAMVPQAAILEQIVCEKYYARVDGHEGDASSLFVDECKAEPVQSELAYLLGWQSAFEIIPAMALAVPYGALADRIGRKKVLLLAILGLFMNDLWIRLVYWFHDFFPVRAVWFSGMWQILGAGAATLSSLTYVLVADACPPEQRTTAFSQIRSARLMSMLIFVPLGGVLTKVNPWIPMLISTVFMVAGSATAIIFVPETLPLVSGNRPSDESEGLLAGESASRNAKSIFQLRNIATKVANLWRWTVRNIRVIPLVLTFFAFNLGEQASGTLLLQYVSKRLGWSLGKASYLVSIQAAVNIVVLTFVIPAISTVLIRNLQLSVSLKDKRIAQVSAVFLTLGSGAFFLAMSPAAMVTGQLLTSLGDVFSLPLRSLATGMVEQHHLGTLYMVIEVVSQAGLFTGHPLLAGAFRWGMRLGPFWMGMPFLIAAVCFLVGFLAVSTAPVRGVEDERDGEEIEASD